MGGKNFVCLFTNILIFITYIILYKNTAYFGGGGVVGWMGLNDVFAPTIY